MRAEYNWRIKIRRVAINLAGNLFSMQRVHPTRAKLTPNNIGKSPSLILGFHDSSCLKT